MSLHSGWTESLNYTQLLLDQGPARQVQAQSAVSRQSYQTGFVRIALQATGTAGARSWCSSSLQQRRLNSREIPNLNQPERHWPKTRVTRLHVSHFAYWHYANAFPAHATTDSQAGSIHLAVDRVAAQARPDHRSSCSVVTGDWRLV